MSGGTDNSRNIQGLQTQAHELVKQFIVYDGADRPSEVFTARADAGDGDFCTKVDYTYVNPTASRVEKMRESNATWSAAYDI